MHVRMAQRSGDGGAMTLLRGNSESGEPTLRPSDCENLAGTDTGREQCIQWQGYIKPNGYGQAHRPRPEARELGVATTDYAHRLVWERENGPIPAGHDVHHRCENRACVNLNHLELLTRQEHHDEHVEARDRCRPGRHEWATEEDIYVDPAGRRQCRECRREANARHRARAAA